MSVDPALSRRPLHLELGCGSSKRSEDSVGIDLLEAPCVDIVGDALSVLRDLDDASVSSVYSQHFLEHLDDPLAMVTEATRVLEPRGVFEAVVPHFSNPAYYSDPTHRTPFGLYTFSYWARSTPFTRQVPHYTDPLPLDPVSARLVFKSHRSFYVRHALKKATSAWVNASTWTQELYEKHLCWLMPCYEVRYVLRRA